MQIFVDTANIEQIRQAVRLGVVSGVTTNPSLLSREKNADYEKVIKEICALVPGSVSTEVLAEDTVGMIEEARVKASWAPNVTIKIPVTKEGLEATSILNQEDIEVNMTLCFSVNQAMLAALAGAAYVSVFVGRLDDIGHDGMEVVREAVAIFEDYQFPAQVIAASIRHPLHVTAAAGAGADIATVPYGVLMQMVQHPLTDIGIKRFLADWQSALNKQ